jgi:trimethylamine--corrinoid protein Co-methyltransferase
MYRQPTGQSETYYAIVSEVLRGAKGIDVSDESLALDVISRVKPEGNFMSQPHTIKHIESELYIPRIFDKVDPKNVLLVAKERAREILATHKPEPLDEQIKQKLRTIIQDTKRRNSTNSSSVGSSSISNSDRP